MASRYLVLAPLIFTACSHNSLSVRQEKQFLEVQFYHIADYNPTTSSLPLPPDIQRYLDEGLDGKDCCISPPKDRDKFKRMVLEEAEKLGYTEERIKALSIKESVILTNKILSSRFDYYGESTIRSLQQAEKNAISPLLKYVFSEMRAKFDGLRSSIGPEATKYLDNEPAEVIFEAKEIVCRHYAAEAVAVYNCLKSINPNLVNSSVTRFSTMSGHIWDQATAISKSSQGMRLDITFVDPTYSDTGGDFDAIDEIHLGQRYRESLDRYLENFRRNFEDRFDISIDPAVLDSVLRKERLLSKKRKSKQNKKDRKS